MTDGRIQRTEHKDGAKRHAASLSSVLRPLLARCAQASLSSVIRTQNGDMLDALCHQHYPDIKPSEAMPVVLAANPGLEQQPAVLPEGMTITLPDIPRPAPEAAIELWS